MAHQLHGEGKSLLASTRRQDSGYGGKGGAASGNISCRISGIGKTSSYEKTKRTDGRDKYMQAQNRNLRKMRGKAMKRGKKGAGNKNGKSRGRWARGSDLGKKRETNSQETTKKSAGKRHVLRKRSKKKNRENERSRVQITSRKSHSSVKRDSSLKRERSNSFKQKGAYRRGDPLHSAQEDWA